MAESTSSILMNIARLFSAYRLLERQVARERVRHRVEVAHLKRALMEQQETAQLQQAHAKEVDDLKRELLEWQNRVLAQANIKPLPNPFVVVPPKPETKPILRPPVGMTAKREYLAEQAKRQENIPTAEQVLGV